jgi:hypothetical protein
VGGAELYVSADSLQVRPRRFRGRSTIYWERGRENPYSSRPGRSAATDANPSISSPRARASTRSRLALAPGFVELGIPPLAAPIGLAQAAHEVARVRATSLPFEGARAGGKVEGRADGGETSQPPGQARAPPAEGEEAHAGAQGEPHDPEARAAGRQGLEHGQDVGVQAAL